MISRKILCIITEIIAVFFYILFLGKLSLYTLVFSFAFPLLMFLVTLTARFTVKASVVPSSPGTVKGEKTCFCVTIRNKSFLPFPKSVVKLVYFNSLSGEREELTVDIPIHPRAAQTLNLSFIPDYCGTLNAEVTGIRVYDYIKLFSWNVKQHSEAQTIVFPSVFGEGDYRVLSTIENTDSDRFSKIKSGDDPSEIFELKDYAKGDKLSRIHWNLSSRQSTLITKHYSLGISSPIAVVPDIDFDNTCENLDNTLEIFYNVCFLLISSGVVFEIFLPFSGERVRVDDCEGLNICYMELLKGVGAEYGFEDKLREMAGKMSGIFYITNRSREQVSIFGDEISCLQSYAFVGEDFKRYKRQAAGNMKILEVPLRMAQRAAEEIML